MVTALPLESAYGPGYTLAPYLRSTRIAVAAQSPPGTPDRDAGHRQSAVVRGQLRYRLAVNGAIND
ncbi:hypothetical protein GCM10018772_21990 [Streptomyces fumanus]|uniref:Uncharacterized protein n=1 Tax=Streptomyces fumanus TaxID=67302 RepID=A0A919ABL2_9ACTN|nr:hypothetical protein GCM10018772_21990 [Streptomyces fumanus]